MDICLSHFSALRLLMRTRNANAAQRTLRRTMQPPSHAVSKTAVAELRQIIGEDKRLDILVSSPKGRRNDSATHSHCCAISTLPRGAFRSLALPKGNTIITCSPEFVFLQLASALSFSETVYIGHALCSSYRIDPALKGSIDVREGSDRPLTTKASISSFLDSAKGMHGCNKARLALPYIHENSRSPMESALAMGYGLPVCYGGFGLGNVQLNQPIRLFDGSETGSRRYASRIPDLTISASGRDGILRTVLVDFDADSVHATRTKLAQDSRRRNQLATIDVAAHISMTSDQALEFRSYAHIAEQIRIALKRQDALRASSSSRDAGTRARYKQLRERQVSLWKNIVCYSPFRQQE